MVLLNYPFWLSNDVNSCSADAEKSLKEAEEEPKKSKGLIGTIRDWVAPAADKTRGEFISN